MKVLLISPLPPPEGGIAVWTKKYKDYCAQHGPELVIVNTALIGARAERINRKRNYADEVRRTFRVLKDLHKKLKNNNPDIVHLNTSCSRFGLYRDYLCLRMAVKKHKPLILHCRCNVEDQLGASKSSHRLFEKMVKQADRVLVLNRKSKQYAEKIAGSKVILVPNFVDEKMLSDSITVHERIQEVVFVGHVQKTKGAEEILEAASHLPQIHFNMIGPVQDEIAKKDRPINVEYIGNLPSQEVREHLKRADVFVFPSYTEGFSNALVEAMGMGLPVVTTDVGANHDMIEENGGIIVPVGDGMAIVSALEKIDAIQVRKEMSEWNRNKVRKCYLQDEVMKQLLAIYREVIA